MQGQVIQLQHNPPVAEILLNRPDKLNAINMAWIAELNEAVDLVADDSRIKLVLIRGAGRSFCAGLDLDMMAAEGMPSGFYEGQERAFHRLETMDKLVVAAIHGHCLGGGVQLAISCDFRVCSTDAVLALPAANEGLFPGMAPYRLPRLVGLAFARQLVITGGPISPEDALRIGLVDWLFPADRFEEGVQTTVQKLLDIPTAAALHAKHLMRQSFERPFDDVLAESVERLKDCLRSPEVAAASERWQERQRSRRARSGSPQ